MGRRIRNKLDLIKPDFYIQQNNREWQQVTKHQTVSEYQPSSPVLVRSYNTNEKWVPSQVTEDLGRLHYNVDVDGKVSKRHVDQLRHYTAPEQKVETVPLESNDVNMHEQPIVSEFVTPSESVDRRVLPARGTRGVPPKRLDL